MWYRSQSVLELIYRITKKEGTMWKNRLEVWKKTFLREALFSDKLMLKIRCVDCTFLQLESFLLHFSNFTNDKIEFTSTSLFIL